MNQSDSVAEDLFTLTVDQYGRLWLHTKLEDIEVAIDLADQNDAFVRERCSPARTALP